MKLPPVPLEATIKMLSEIAGRELRISGGTERCMLVDKSLVDVLRSGFVTREALAERAAAALAFWQIGAKKTTVAEEPQGGSDVV